MPRTPDEIFAEINTLPLADRLRLAARIVEHAAHLASTTPTAPMPASPTRASTVHEPTAPPTSGPVSSRPPTPSPAPRPEPRRMIIVDGSNFLGTTAGYNLAS